MNTAPGPMTCPKHAAIRFDVRARVERADHVPGGFPGVRDSRWRSCSSAMADHTELTPSEAADRLAIRELFDAYAHRADRRDAERQKALFTADTGFVVYMEGAGSEAAYVLEGREALTPVFADLNRYEATTHFNSTVAGTSPNAISSSTEARPDFCIHPLRGSQEHA